MKLRFVYPRFARHAEAHPELREHVPCNEYFGPPSLGIACLAAVTPPEWDIDFRDDRVEDVGLDDEDVDLVAISTFTPSARRAIELADAFRARGRKVVAGGVFPSLMPSEVAPHVDAVVVGEGEAVWPRLLEDARAGSLAPRYEGGGADLATLPLPRVDLYLDKESDAYRPDDYPLQISRGCPMTCVACALPTSMGRRLRSFSVEHALGQIDQLAARGKLGSLTEDTSLLPGSVAQRKFGELLDALAARGGPARVSYLGTSMPMVLTTPESMLRRMRAAGIDMFYLVGGFDPITTRAFTGRDPGAKQRALDAVKRSLDHGIEPYTSFLVGNDDDDDGTFDRMLAFADEAGIRKAEFAIMTPYPGTPSWHRLVREERILHRDWSRYNDANVVFQPLQMTPERLLEGYLYLWREFYRSRQGLRALEREARTIQF
jgi:radical SAM superfamily enzyme YgiQ (UPF0313 family)